MILDTNALSAWADGKSGAEEPLQSARLLVVPSVVLGEYFFGIRQSRKRTYYEKWLAENLRFVELATIGHATAGHYAEIRIELKNRARPIPSNDAWIAALARQHELPVMSNDQHFDLVSGLERIPF